MAKTERLKEDGSCEKAEVKAEHEKKNLEELEKQLYDLFADTKTPREIAELFDDLCTKKEIIQMAQRLEAARLLMSGKTYTEVMVHCDISTATLSRVSRSVQYGKGYRRAFSHTLSAGE